jgi:hypothetical protein
MQNLNSLNSLVMYHRFTWFIDVFTIYLPILTNNSYWLNHHFPSWHWCNGKWNIAFENAGLHNKDDLLFLSLMSCYIHCDLTPMGFSCCEYRWLQHFPTWRLLVSKLNVMLYSMWLDSHGLELLWVWVVAMFSHMSMLHAEVHFQSKHLKS